MSTTKKHYTAITAAEQNVVSHRKRRPSQEAAGGDEALTSLPCLEGGRRAQPGPGGATAKVSEVRAGPLPGGGRAGAGASGPRGAVSAPDRLPVCSCTYSPSLHGLTGGPPTIQPCTASPCACAHTSPGPHGLTGGPPALQSCPLPPGPRAAAVCCPGPPARPLAGLPPAH